jgi:hypothetical protein
MQEISERRPPSPSDYARILKLELPEGRRPYILARHALTLQNPDSFNAQKREEAAEEAIQALADANMDGTLQPPLGNQLTEEINSFVDEFRAGQRRMVGEAVGVLLSWAIDDGTKSQPEYR